MPKTSSDLKVNKIKINVWCFITDCKVTTCAILKKSCKSCFILQIFPINVLTLQYTLRFLFVGWFWWIEAIIHINLYCLIFWGSKVRKLSEYVWQSFLLIICNKSVLDQIIKKSKEVKIKMLLKDLFVWLFKKKSLIPRDKKNNTVQWVYSRDWRNNSTTGLTGVYQHSTHQRPSYTWGVKNPLVEVICREQVPDSFRIASR